MSDVQRLQGKQVLITGATGGIGLAGAVGLARQGAGVAIVGRDAERTERALQLIGAAVPAGGPAPRAFIADLSSQAEVARVASEALAALERIDVLVNNAGALFGSRQSSADGIEMTLALNHMAPFLITKLLLERLRQSAPARVITTASDAHKGQRFPFDDIPAAHGYGRAGFSRYGQSKLANILFTSELARQLAGSGVSAYCFHPGVVATGFNRNNGALMNGLMRTLGPFLRSPDRGAETMIWLAGSEDLSDQDNGGYFVDCKRREPSAAARDSESARMLWELSEKLLVASVRAQ